MFHSLDILVDHIDSLISIVSESRRIFKKSRSDLLNSCHDIPSHLVGETVQGNRTLLLRQLATLLECLEEAQAALIATERQQSITCSPKKIANGESLVQSAIAGEVKEERNSVKEDSSSRSSNDAECDQAHHTVCQEQLSPESRTESNEADRKDHFRENLQEWDFLAAKPLTRSDVKALQKFGGLPARIFCPMTLDKETESVFSNDAASKDLSNTDDQTSECSIISEEDIILEGTEVAKKQKSNSLHVNGKKNNKEVCPRSVKTDGDLNDDEELDALMRTSIVALKDKNQNWKSSSRTSSPITEDSQEAEEDRKISHCSEGSDVVGTSRHVNMEKSSDKPTKEESVLDSKKEVSSRKLGTSIRRERGISTEEQGRGTVKNKLGSEKKNIQNCTSSKDEDEEECLLKTKSDRLEDVRLNLSESDVSEVDLVEENLNRNVPCRKKLKKRKRILSSDSDEGALGPPSVDDDDIEELSSGSSIYDVDTDDTGSFGAKNEATTEKTKKNKHPASRRKKRARFEEDSSDDESVSNDEEIIQSKRRGVKPIIGKEKLAKETINAEIAEKERRKRLEAKQKEFNGIEFDEGQNIATALSTTPSGPLLKRVLLDPDSKSELPHPVEVHSTLVRHLKPHQAEGIKFLYESTIESLDRLNEDGGGGILAHCMGLGKTLQVIAFLHTILMHPVINKKIHRILVIAPKNVVLQWCSEFAKWLDNEEDDELQSIQVMELDSFKSYNDRSAALKNWYNSEKPVVMVIGYDMFRILTQGDDDKLQKKSGGKKMSKMNKKLARLQPAFREYLQDPGPDLIVCDEAHKLKNDESALTRCIAKIRTKRRICLTGTPLQNNLMEYHCMVNFVKPGLLGTKKEFANRFANIINRGKTKDATASDVRYMKRRCHVLFEQLKKVVDRKDHHFLTDVLPPKQEYVINVRLTPRQVALYRAFLEGIGKDDIRLGKRLLTDYHVLSRIWTHPYQLITHDRQEERRRILQEDRDGLDDFIDDGETTASSEEADDDVIPLDEDGEPVSDIPAGPIRKSKRLAGEDAEFDSGPSTPTEYQGWFANTGLVSEEDINDFSLGRKLILLQAVIKKCEEIGDKILVFSQSLESLCLIKRMLRYLDENDLWFSDGHEALKAESDRWGWKEGHDYLVIDGQVQSSRRDELQKKFNNLENLRARLMLISTRAGSLGTNMIAANRVVIFDACWNPSHDTQSLFRVYRFGQTKPVYIYRFIAQGTMEERIYKRQVTKESTSMRVVDEAQIERHFAVNDLEELYNFDPDENNGHDPSQAPSIAPPKDRLLADIILSHTDCIVNYIQHDSLFKNLEEEKLTEEECKEAWNDYENEKNAVNRIVNMPQDASFAFGQARIFQPRQNQYGNLVPLNMDPIYMSAYQVRGMNVDTALKVAYVKQSLERLLPTIPVHLRGNTTGFASTFHNLIYKCVRESNTPATLLAEAVKIFRTVVGMVREYPDCIPVLRHLYRLESQFFDPNVPPP